LARLLSTLLVVFLLGGTAAAFAVTEGLKLEKSPISRTNVDELFSPGCDCANPAAHISFHLRRRDRLRLSIVAADGAVVREVADVSLRSGMHYFRWDGLEDGGAVAPDGVYKPRVHLDRAHKTIELPNEIVVDTVPPRFEQIRVGRRIVSPDGDRRGDDLIVSYRLDEPAHPLLYLDDRLRVRVKSGHPDGQLRLGPVRGRPLPAGRYRISVAAQDAAGNVSKPVRLGTVRVRYVELARHVIRAGARTRIGVRVRTDALRYRWRLGKRSGVASGGLLVLRVGAAGRYRLVVTARGHADRALVIVRPRR
jgi:hypothetical protein